MDALYTIIMWGIAIVGGAALLSYALDEYGGNSIRLAVLGLFLAYKWLQAVSDDLNSWAFFGWSWAGFFYIAYVLTREKKAE